MGTALASIGGLDEAEEDPRRRVVVGDDDMEARQIAWNQRRDAMSHKRPVDSKSGRIR